MERDLRRFRNEKWNMIHHCVHVGQKANCTLYSCIERNVGSRLRQVILPLRFALMRAPSGGLYPGLVLPAKERHRPVRQLPEESYKENQKVVASPLRRQTKRVGFVQCEKEKDQGRSYSDFSVPKEDP